MARKLIYRRDIEGHGDIEQDDTRLGSVRAGGGLGRYFEACTLSTWKVEWSERAPAAGTSLGLGHSGLDSAGQLVSVPARRTWGLDALDSNR